MDALCYDRTLTKAAGAKPDRVTEILEEGRNCWRTVAAERVAILIDGCAYFAQIETALRKAQRSILIVGWDFDGHIKLCPDRSEDEAVQLGQLLRDLVESKPALEVRVLVWSTAVLHAPSAPTELLIGDAWQHHPRIQVRLDTTHPFYAAHHQKIVCIDGALAFVGGMDLTVDRWDTPEHAFEDPRRICPNGKPYGPVHDLHMLVDGEAARAVCSLAHVRWAEATGEHFRHEARTDDIWPADLEPDFEQTRLGISRVMPEWGKRRGIRESARLTADALKAARRSIFIEAQYFTAAFVGDILERKLRDPEGPEVVAIVSLASHSLIERAIMGENRDRLIRRLAKADRHGRLRIYTPVVCTPDGECPILVHSKLIIIDDRLMRIGSSNLNNRSIGLDSELDISIEARDGEESAAIIALRERLLGEHLDVSPQRVADAFAETGSLVRTIERLNAPPRGLRPFEALSSKGPTHPVWGTSFLDPSRPFEPLWLRRRRRHRHVR